MKKLVLYAITLLFILLFVQCETAVEPPEHTIEIKTATPGFKTAVVNAKQIGKITQSLQAETGFSLLQKDTPGGAVFDIHNILEVIDTLKNASYSFRFAYPDTPEHIFYNLVVSADSTGTLQTPYVVKYECDPEHLQDFKDNGYQFQFFRGAVALHPFSHYFGDGTIFNKTDPECVQYDQYGDPIPCLQTDVGTGGTGGGDPGTGFPTGSTTSGTGNSGGGGTGGYDITLTCSCVGHTENEIEAGICTCHTFILTINGNAGNANKGLKSTDCPPCTLPGGSAGVNIYPMAVNQLNLILGNQLTPEQLDWLEHNADINQELNDFLLEEGYSVTSKTEALMRLYAEMANENGWNYTQTGIFPNRPSLNYVATYHPNPGETMYLLENDLVLYQSATKRVVNPAQDAITLAASEPELNGYNYIYSYNTKRWYEYRLPEPSYTETDLSFLFETFWKGVKLFGRYATPLEDIIILIDGKDFDGQEASKALAGGMLIVGFIPGGKLVKPLTKTVKTATTAIEIVIKEGGQYVIESIGTAINVEIKAIPLDDVVKYISSTGEEVARIANNIFTVSKHQIKPQAGSVVFRNADEVNNSLIPFGYNDPPFTDTVVEFVTEESEQFVRFHNISNKEGPWIMKASEVQHLTEIQIRDLFSIPPGNPIPKVSHVDIPDGTKLYSGTSNDLYGLSGGGQQFYIDRTQFFNNLIPDSWFGSDIDISNFLD